MTVTDAERAGRVATANTGCGLTFDPEPDTGLRYGDIHVSDTAGGIIVGFDISTPAITTISGMHVGNTRDDVHRTYPNAVDVDAQSTTITNPEGRKITFWMSRDGTVVAMSLYEPGPVGHIDPQC